MASILGIGNALTDILAVLPDDKFLKEFHLPRGSMQHVDMETGDKIWQTLRPMGVQLVAGGSAANTITGTAIFGMESGFIGKVGDDDLGHLFKSDQAQYGIRSMLMKGSLSSGRSMVFITAPNAERTFAVYLGAALELVPEDLKPEYFEGYDYFHIEGYLVQNQALMRRAVELAKAAGCKISIDMASYNAEFRWRFVSFPLWRQNIAFALNLFSDGTMVTKEYDMAFGRSASDFASVEEYAQVKGEYDAYMAQGLGHDRPHITLGVGLRFIMNQNFIVCFEYGKPIGQYHKQDGNGAFYMNIGYLF